MKSDPKIQHNGLAPVHRPPEDEPERVGEGELDPTHYTNSLPKDNDVGQKTDQLSLPGVDIDIAELAVRTHLGRPQ